MRRQRLRKLRLAKLTADNDWTMISAGRSPSDRYYLGAIQITAEKQMDEIRIYLDYRINDDGSMVGKQVTLDADAISMTDEIMTNDQIDAEITQLNAAIKLLRRYLADQRKLT